MGPCHPRMEFAWKTGSLSSKKKTLRGRGLSSPPDVPDYQGYTMSDQRQVTRASRSPATVTSHDPVRSGRYRHRIYSDSETMALESTSKIVDIVVSTWPSSSHARSRASQPPLPVRLREIRAAHDHGGRRSCDRDLHERHPLLRTRHPAPDPFEDAYLIVIYAAASFLVSVIFGVWMRSVGKRAGSPLVMANADLWIVGGWLALRGVCSVRSQHRPWPHGEDRGRRLH